MGGIVRSPHAVGIGVLDGPKQWGLFVLPDADKVTLPIQAGPSRTPVPTEVGMPRRALAAVVKFTVAKLLLMRQRTGREAGRCWSIT